MRSIFAITITFFLLTACSQAPIPATPTVANTNTPLPTPTGTPAPSATPTTTYTPTTVPTLTPEQQLAIETVRFGITQEISAAKYNIGYDKDGKIELREKTTNKLIYWDGKWNSEKIVEMIVATNDCRATKFRKVPGQYGPPKDQDANWRAQIIDPLFNLGIQRSFFPIDKNGGLVIQLAQNLPRTDNCWVVFFIQDNVWLGIDWFDADKVVQNAQLFDPTKIK